MTAFAIGAKEKERMSFILTNIIFVVFQKFYRRK
jgi:hypothetical protein